MSHGITKSDSAAFFGQAAWHGLGSVLDDADPARKDVALAIAASGLGWQVGLSPLAIQAAGNYTVGEGDDARNFTVSPEMGGAAIPDQYAVCRLDNNTVLGVVGKQYRPLQNLDQFKWFQPFLDSGQAQFETCGSLHGGRTVWILAKCGDDLTVIPDSQQPDTIKPYLLLASSHDGSKATRLGFTPIRVVCANTLGMAERAEQSKLLKVKHTRGQDIALEQVRTVMDLARGGFQATAEQYAALAQCEINRQELVDYVRIVFEQPTAEIERQAAAALANGQIAKIPSNQQISTRMANILDAVLDCVATAPGHQMGEGTVWGAMQGVTYYVTHQAGRTQSSRLASQWFGEGQKRLDRAMSVAKQMAS